MNQLHQERSAYLLQHKDNPVHWRSYGPEAVERAKSLNRPIFLSIGYSSCHWCHVMAHESFEDPAVAQFLNRHFICVKADKEEHPDLDQYYQKACGFFIRMGGWPLSAFLLPDLRPFFAGTYFPKESFGELLAALARAYREQPGELENQANRFLEFLKTPEPPRASLPASDQILQAVFQKPPTAPRFPHFAFYQFALEEMQEGRVGPENRAIVVGTLEQMLRGGIYDHARGGIHRYSTDKDFLVPHFEKMLYDQAGFLRVLARLTLFKPSPLVNDALKDTLEYLRLEMLSDEGYFFASQDADSEGQEGLYFTYTKKEFDRLVEQIRREHPRLDFSRVREWFSVSERGNFERGLNVVSLNPQSESAPWEVVRLVRKAILKNRHTRIPPATDNKGIASWNFQLVCALCDVVQYTSQAGELLESALSGLYRVFVRDSVLHSTTLNDNPLYLEDYANLADAEIRAYETTANPLFKHNAKKTLDFILSHFVSRDKVFVRALGDRAAHLTPNQEAGYFDLSFKSSAATLIHTIRRARVLFQDPGLGRNLNFDRMKNEASRNPPHTGEALRASIEPDRRYRVVKIPSHWIGQKDFKHIATTLTPRFVLDYHWEKTEAWEVCTTERCLAHGRGMESLVKAGGKGPPAAFSL